MSSEAGLCDHSHRNNFLVIMTINVYLFNGINKDINPNKTKLTNKTPSNQQIFPPPKKKKINPGSHVTPTV